MKRAALGSPFLMRTHEAQSLGRGHDKVVKMARQGEDALFFA